MSEDEQASEKVNTYRLIFKNNSFISLGVTGLITKFRVTKFLKILTSQLSKVQLAGSLLVKLIRRAPNFNSISSVLGTYSQMTNDLRITVIRILSSRILSSMEIFTTYS